MSGWTDERTGLAMVSGSWEFESAEFLWWPKRTGRSSFGQMILFQDAAIPSPSSMLCGARPGPPAS
jgi:hypothetical protein